MAQNVAKRRTGIGCIQLRVQLKGVDLRELTKETGQGCGVGDHPFTLVCGLLVRRGFLQRPSGEYQLPRSLRRVQGMTPLRRRANAYQGHSREETGDDFLHVVGQVEEYEPLPTPSTLAGSRGGSG